MIGKRCLRIAPLSLLGIFVLAGAAQAIEPSLGAIAPYGLQRGTETVVQFRGARLGETEQLLLYSPGFEVKQIEKVNDKAVKATLAVAPDCRLGIHAVRLRTKSGISNLRTFCVGDLPEVQEDEPNDEFESPQPLELNSTINGVVRNEDVDYYVVEAKKGQRLVAELTGVRLGNRTFFDPYLAILDADRFELARSDDVSLLRQDSLCSVVVPEDGKYVLQVRESAYGGNGNCKYRLHVGTFPRPTAVVPAGGRPGETLEVRWVGDPAGDWTQEITLPEQEHEQFALFAEDGQGVAPSPNRIRVVDLPNSIETEPNDSREEASSGTAPGALNGVIGEPGDLDYFKFTAEEGQKYDVRVYARNTLRSPLDSVLNIQNAKGRNLEGNDDADGPDSYVRFDCPADGDYFVRIRDHLDAGGPDYAYRVEISPVQPALTMNLPEKRRYVSTTIPVHRGNRTALMVNASRENWRGELEVDFEGLPKGMGFEAPVMPANRSTIPVLLSADEDASTDGALVALTGLPVDDNLDLVGHLQQRTMLVRGRNNRDVWGHDAKRAAVSVADEVPFEIEIVQPQVPIVRNGAMELKVVAKRQEGFDAEISVRMLYNPPGIGSSGSISIPKGETEAMIPLTANGRARIGQWPIVVRGLASYGGGTAEVASQMAELEIADSFFDFAFQKSAGELGKEATLVVNVENKVDFPETAEVQLRGLPANTSTTVDSVEIDQDSTEILFPIEISEKAKPKTYKSLVCRATIVRNGEPITHNLGRGQLRIDKPIAPKEDASKDKSKAKAKTAEKSGKKDEKPLSRLEQLRLEREKEKEAAGG